MWYHVVDLAMLGNGGNLMLNLSGSNRTPDWRHQHPLYKKYTRMRDNAVTELETHKTNQGDARAQLRIVGLTGMVAILDLVIKELHEYLEKN
jgi:DNA primase